MAPAPPEKRHDMSGKAKGKASPPSPSASIILVSPSNQILLLHRVQTSSSFPSAHVFPGGNLEPEDGPVPPTQTDPARHKDNLAYRTGAIRELFEESGILLARRAPDSTDKSSLLEVSAADRRRGRRAVHQEKNPFGKWLKSHTADATLDTSGLIPFTHWTTPINVPKRFTTQMYVYFVPLAEHGNESIAPLADDIETMDAEWAPARTWLDRSRKGEIILFPPQFLLLYLMSQHLDEPGPARSDDERLARRQKLQHFIDTDSEPPWKDKYISPVAIASGKDGRAALGLDTPGPELKDSGLKGEMDRVVLVQFQKEGPRKVEVGWRKEVLQKFRDEKDGGASKI